MQVPTDQSLEPDHVCVCDQVKRLMNSKHLRNMAAEDVQRAIGDMSMTAVVRRLCLLVSFSTGRACNMTACAGTGWSSGGAGAQWSINKGDG